MSETITYPVVICEGLGLRIRALGRWYWPLLRQSCLRWFFAAVIFSFVFSERVAERVGDDSPDRDLLIACVFGCASVLMRVLFEMKERTISITEEYLHMHHPGMVSQRRRLYIVNMRLRVDKRGASIARVVIESRATGDRIVFGATTEDVERIVAAVSSGGWHKQDGVHLEERSEPQDTQGECDSAIGQNKD